MSGFNQFSGLYVKHLKENAFISHLKLKYNLSLNLTLTPHELTATTLTFHPT
jgi:hypothetical protein